ncbi:amidohydrolase family protein [Microbacterium sp. GXF7504]
MNPIEASRLLPGQEVARLRGVVHADGSDGDIAIAGGQVVTDAGTGTDVDASGWLALTPLADLHAHLDKAYTWDAAGRPEGSLEDAVACWQRFGALLTEEEIAANARRQVLAALGAGVTAIRTHANYHEGPDPLRGIRALIALREEFRGLVDIQVVALHGSDRGDDVVREAVALGIDLIGGVPHLAADPAAELDRTLRLAEEAGLGVDLHADETLAPEAGDLLRLAERTRDWPAARTRAAGHCVSLAMVEPDRLDHVLRASAEASVSIITNPLTNLYLQGWRHPVATPRGIPPLRTVIDAGVTLAAGGDNVQDPFNPLGNGDMVDVVAALVLAGHLAPAEAWRVTAAGGRDVFGLPRADGRPGDPADLLLVRARTVAEAVAERAPDRVVIRAGRVVAVRRSQTLTVDVADRAEVPA